MSKSERKNLSQPADWWSAFERQAAREGHTLSHWMGLCCIANLPVIEQKKLTERPPAHRPRKEPDS
jgi:hypothetical protein